MSLDVNISEPDEFNCIELHDSIKNVAEMKNIKDFTYHVDVVCGKGANYIANVFRVLINDTETKNSISVIVKTLINISRKGLFSDIHNREACAYQKIVNKYIELQNQINVSDRIALPKCILLSVDRGNEIIILEDLLCNGFEIDDKIIAYEKLNFAQAKIIFDFLAKFHALSFVYENNENLKFDELRKDFDDVLYKSSFLSKSKLKSYFIESFEMSLNLIEDDLARTKLETVKIKLLQLLRMYTSPRKYNVFCHGDCWLNNILFKTDENRTEVCFIDFQTMRYASPVTDILYFLYVNTNSKFRLEYFEVLKASYYTSFQMFLKLFNMDASLLYPEEAFRKDIEDFQPYGLIVALIELRIATTNPDDEINLKQLATSKDNFNEDSKRLKLYQSRVNDVCDQYVRNGMLDKLLDTMKYLEE